MRRTAFWLSVAVVFTLPWENVVDVPGLGSISRAIGLATAATWVLAVLGSGSVRPPRLPHVVALLFVLWNGLSVIWSVDPEVSLGRFFTFAQLFLMIYIFWDTARTYADVRIVLQAYVLGGWVTAFSLIRQYVVHGGAQYQVRFTIGDFQFTELSLVLGLGVPMAWYLGTNPGRAPHRYPMQVVNLAYVPAAVVAMMFSGSRAGMVALLPTLVYIAVTLMRLSPRLRIAAGAGLVGLFVALVPLVPPGTIQRLTSTAGDRRSGDLDGRTELWSQAYLTFKEHPFTGVGTGAFREETSWKVAHNVWLRFCAELGLPGIGLFLLLLGALVVYAWRQPPAMRGFSLSILASWSIGATFYNAEDRKQTWLVFSLVMLLAAVARRQPLEPEPPAPAEPALLLPYPRADTPSLR